MSKNSVTIILLVLTATVAYLGVWPEWERISADRQEANRLSSVFNELVELLDKQKVIRDAYNEIDPQDLQKLAIMAPQKQQTSSALVDFEILAQRSGVFVQSVDFTASRSSKTTMVAAGPYQPIPLNMTVQGPYASFVDFLKNLENNLRVVDVTEISFGKGFGNAPAASSAAANKNLTVTMKGFMYYKP